MDTIVRPPDAASTVLVPRRRRAWRWLVIVAFVLLLAGITFGSIWLSNHDPFVPGSFGYAPPAAATRVVDVDSFGVQGRIFEVPGEAGAVVRYRFSILNDGPFAVTITSIGDPAASQVGMAVSRVPVGVVPDVWARDDSGMLTPFQPWHSFTMAPGQEAAIEMEATNHPCVPDASSVSWWFENIRFTIFGIPRETTFEQDVEVRFEGVRDC